MFFFSCLTRYDKPLGMSWIEQTIGVAYHSE